MNRRVVVITNHFVDPGTHRVFRIDPATTFSGRTFAGIGAPSRRGFMSTGVRRGEERILNPSRSFRPPSEGRRTGPSPGERRVAPPSSGKMGAPSVWRRTFAPPSSGRSVAPPARGGGPSQQFQKR